MNIEELSSHMGPAGRLDDPSTGEQLVEPGIAIGMDDAAEVLQVRPRVLALAVRRVEEQRRRRAGPREPPPLGPLGPQPPSLGLPGAWRQYLPRPGRHIPRVRPPQLN